MSIVDSIRKQMVPIHREGYVYIAAFAIGAFLLSYLHPALGWIGLILTAWCVYFFRDPERTTPQRDGLVISPADGRVSMIASVVPPAELQWSDKPMTRVSIFHECV